MRASASIAGHPLHPMLVVIPAGGILITLVLDIVHLATGNDDWWLATRPVLLVAVIGGVIAAIPGLIDLRNVPPGEAMNKALAHAGLNVLLLLVTAFSVWMRYTWEHSQAGAPGLTSSVISVLLLGGTGWLGWALVQTHHVGVLEAGEGGEPPEIEPVRRTTPLEHPATPAPG
jgi:uncharacterized membrane protein